MNILVLNGSPRKNGNTSRLVEAFKKGAEEAGHTVTVEMTALQDVKGCKACEYCHTKGNGKCIQNDDMQHIYQEIQSADMLVLASPVYYFTMTAQLQCAVHRTYALGPLTNIKKTALILSSISEGVYGPSVTQYLSVAEWWGSEDAGIFTVPGKTPTNSLDNIPDGCLEKLYQFGKSLN